MEGIPPVPSFASPGMRSQESQAKLCRKYVYSFVSRYNDKLDAESDWVLFFHFVKEILKQFADTFVPAVHHSSVVPTKDHEFVLWIFSCFLKVLAQVRCAAVYDGTADCLRSILSLSRSKDITLFHWMLKELIHLSADVGDLGRLCSSNNLNFPVYLSHFQYSRDKEGEGDKHKESDADMSVPDGLAPPLIELQQYSHLVSLQKATLTLLVGFSDEICQLTAVDIQLLCQGLSSSIQYGGMGVKQHSLTVLEGVMAKAAPVNKPTMDHLTWCLIALFSVVTNGHTTGKSVSKSIEVSLARCLHVMFYPDEGEPLVVRRFWDPLLDALNDCLMEATYTKCCIEIQRCIGELVFKCCVLELEQSCYTAEAIIYNIGKARNLQPLVAALCHLLRSKFGKTQASVVVEDGGLGNQPDDGPSQAKRPRVDSDRKKLLSKKKKGARSTPVVVPSSPLPLLVSLMTQRGLHCAKQIIALCGDHESRKQESQLLYHVEGVRMVLEVWVRVVLNDLEGLPSHWLNLEQLRTFCQAWEAALFRAMTIHEESSEEQQSCSLNTILSAVIDSVGVLLAFASQFSISSVVTDRCLWIIGLPWQQSPHPGMDLVAGSSLTTQQCQQVKEAMMKIGECIGAKCNSLWALSALPVHTGHSQRQNILLQAFEDNLSEVYVVALNVLPVLLGSLDKETIPLLLSAVIKMKPDIPRVQLALANQLPAILLAASTRDSIKLTFAPKDVSVPLHHTCNVGQLLSKGKHVKLDQRAVSLLVEVVDAITDTEVIPALVKSVATLVRYSEDPSPIHSKCLPLFTHEEQHVRNAICEHIQLFFPDPYPETDKFDLETHVVVKKLKETFLTGLRNGNTRMQETAVIAFGQIGRFAKGNLLITCVISLVKFILEPSSVIRANAHVQLQRVTAARGLNTTKLLSQFKEPICDFLVDLLHEKNGLILTEEKKSNPFYKVAAAFEMKDLKQFFESIKDVFIPLLVCRATPQSSESLRFVANVTQGDESPRSMLVECFKHVFLYLVRNGRRKDLSIASKFLKNESDFEMTTLLKMDTKNVVNLLILHLSTHRDRVLNGIQMLVELNQPATESKVDPEKQIAEYLDPHLHGIVAYLNFKLIRLEYFEHSNNGNLAIGSLIELMRLMGPKRITHVKMKVLAILRHCLVFKNVEVTKLTLSAWNCFVQSVELDSLGPLLGQIVVALSPLVDSNPKMIAEIFEFLIVENRIVLGPYFSEIYLMPEAPVLADVNAVLTENSKEPKSWHQQIQHVLRGVSHERSDVRLHALKALHKLLKKNQNELEKCMVGSDTVDPIITEIVTTLLRSLRGSGVELRKEYGHCLGELGAVDPGKLDLPSVCHTRGIMFYEVDGNFAVDLLAELARAYLAAADTRSQDCCAYAIQEVLHIFDCANPEAKGDGAILWSTISSDYQEVLRPHLNSSYSATVPKSCKFSVPVFKPAKHFGFQEWIQKWCTFLIHKLGDSLPKHVFLPCTLVFQHDISPALYLLPHVLTCVLRQGPDKVLKDAKTEVMAVLTHSAHSRDISVELADSTTMCAQTIFTCLDHLTAWANGKRKAAVVRKARGQRQMDNHEETEKVIAFLESIPKDVLAMSAFRCQAYTRALMYLEFFLQSNPEALQKNMGFLQKVYVAIDEPDGVAGVAAVRTAQLSLNEQILQYESTGNYRDAAACYERAIQLEANDLANHEGLLRCMMRQGEFTSALMHVSGLQAEKPEWMRRLNAIRIEAAWKLGQWSDLEHHLKTEPINTKNWDFNLGKLLLAAKQRNSAAFLARLSKVRSEQMGPLSTASLEQGSYQRGYQYIVRLHMLQELEEGVRSLLSTKDQQRTNSEKSTLSSWQTRLQLTQESFRTQESILSLRRVILGLDSSKFGKKIGQYWLESAKIARRAGHLQTAHSFLLNASDYSLPELCMEKAEWMKRKHQGGSHDALLSLQKSVADQWPSVSDAGGQTASRNTTHAEALLLIGQWMEDTAHYDTQTVLKQYKTVISVHPESEDGHFYLGKYYDRLMSVLASDRPAKSAEFLQFILRHYGHALENGSKYLYQCMPRMLTLWLDFGSNVPDGGDERYSGKKSQDKSPLKQRIQVLNDLMHTMMERLPPYQFLIAFPQLISRICHPNSGVFTELKAIILNLLKHYPQQSLWMMIAVSKSTHQDRQSRCKRILDEAKKHLTDIGKIIDDMVKLSDKLLEVCNKYADPSKNHSMDKLCRGLARLTNSSGFSSIMVPLQSSLTVTLPAGHGVGLDTHDPFPGVQPAIVRFEDKVEVLASLQRPKKVTVLASDGNSYILLCKPKDDLRKDARMMEFNSLVNKCLRKDQSCRQRRLHIRTYAVIPLNEECGLLEWVPNTHGFRNILHKLYQEKGLYVTGRELKEMVKSMQLDPVRLKEVFQSKLIPKHPPVFGEWFLRTFPDPTAWYSCRQSYAHTAAVMSMVGYILGLGDRHGENILFDSTNGDCIHVDFNCLFNRGETFDVPEVVPFRLTHNMTHGLGVTGYEGVFRKSCEVTMKVMRQECDALMCVLKTLIHDPLVEWGKVKGRTSTPETTSEKAVKIVKDIEDRLLGKYPKTKGLPLSIEGQVHALIKEATDEDNLSRMYIGWAAFL